MSNFERKFGKYAIPNLTIILIGCYFIGYVMQGLNAEFMRFLTLDPYKIVMKGQVWRILTWIIVPPESFDVLTLLVLFFYYSIGTTMERTLGTYKYNVFIFRGMFLTVIAAILSFAICSVFPQAMLSIFGEEWRDAIMSMLEYGDAAEKNALLSQIYEQLAMIFSTYYINISIFLAFAIVYPQMQVYLMFVIPVKVKYLGVLDLILLAYSFIIGDIFTKFCIGAALINIAIFYASVKRLQHLKPSEIMRRREFQRKVNQTAKIAKHKCAICGQTDEDNPNLEFRFCSKCNGNYEYCEKHLYTHQHVQ